MPNFDAIASHTVRKADHLEPAFAHTGDIEAAARKLAARRRKPNILIYLMDDVGWGDFGCYGGGVAVGAPTPHFDRLARSGLQLTSCYSEPSCSPSRATLHTGRVPHRHGLHRVWTGDITNTCAGTWPTCFEPDFWLERGVGSCRGRRCL